MRVLMFGWEFPPRISGGMGIACAGLAEGLARAGDEVRFVLPGQCQGLPVRDRLTFVTAESPFDAFAPGPYAMPHYTAPHCPDAAADSETQDDSPADVDAVDEARAEAALAQQAGQAVVASVYTAEYELDWRGVTAHYATFATRLANTEEFDIIHCHDWITMPAGMAAKKASGKPLVVHIHSLEIDRCGARANPDIVELERKGMENADCVVAVSNFTRERIVGEYGVDPDKVAVLHNAVDAVDDQPLASVAAPRHRPTVSFIGRITWQKGPEYFVEAAALVRRGHRDAEFVMAGTGDMFAAVRRQAIQLGLEGYIYFPGFLSHEQVEELLDATDVLVMPSRVEPFGIMALEAARARVPVIVSTNSGVRELLPHTPAVEFWNTRALADWINKLLDSPEEHERVVHTNLTSLRTWTWDQAVGKLQQVYAGLCG